MLWPVAAFAQQAKVPVLVDPPQAYVFLDGMAIKEGKQVILKTTPGEHVISVYNYGYQGEIRTVSFTAGWNEPVSFSLKATGAAVPGEFGLIQVEGPGHFSSLQHAAVLLNGNTPEYHVGHVDMFNNHIGWFQQLMVLPGTHQLTVTRFGNTIWSGPVTVAAGERVIVYMPSGRMRRQKVNNAKRTGGPRPRFSAGIASAAVYIAPVSGTLAASPSQINCNDTAQLAYSSVDALHSSLADDSGTKPLPSLSGDMSVQPKHTTTYHFEASGPGGTVRQDATVNVNTVVQSSLEATPSAVTYIKVGNKVMTQESSELKWTATNADAISVTPVGNVAATGEQKLTPEPQETQGKISETQTYTLNASNVCGGSDTKTVQLKINGMIEPYVLSVFFPTAYPTRRHPETGLVASQQERLATLAGIFVTYAEHAPDAKIVVRGHADRRGTDKYNMSLSERRVAAVKGFLVAHGVPEDKIVVEATGKREQLDTVTVQQLETENPFKTESAKKHDARTTWLAYNRRTDVEVQPADVQTTRFYPDQAGDAELLIQKHLPSLKKVQGAQQETATVAGTAGGAN
jgi:hypothetical protein